MSRRAVIWLIPVLLALHNAEEAVAFRNYLPRVKALLPSPFATLEAQLSYTALVQALAILSLLAVAFMFFLAHKDKKPVQNYVSFFSFAISLGWLILAVCVIADIPWREKVGMRAVYDHFQRRFPGRYRGYAKRIPGKPVRGR